MMLCSALINMSLLVLFTAWQPNSKDMYVYFIGAALWGFSDAVWQTQVNGKSLLLVLLIVGHPLSVFRLEGSPEERKRFRWNFGSTEDFPVRFRLDSLSPWKT